MVSVLELQNQLAKLNSGVTRSSGLYFNATHAQSSEKTQAKLQSSYVTSTFPFHNTIQRNESDISLCKLLEHSFVLSDSVDEDDT